MMPAIPPAMHPANAIFAAGAGPGPFPTTFQLYPTSVYPFLPTHRYERLPLPNHMLRIAPWNKSSVVAGYQ